MKFAPVSDMKRLTLLLFILTAVLGRAGEESWKFVRISDTQADTSQWKTTADHRLVNVQICGEIARAIVREKPDLVIVAGDLVTQGRGEAYKLWREVMAPVYQAGIQVYPVRGNHDDSPIAWKNTFGTDIPANGPPGETGFTYFFTNKNALFVGMDVYINTNRLHRINQEWLDKIVAGNTLPHVFVYTHEPAFKLIHADCLGAYPEERNKFWATLKKAGARIYLCGHDHVFDHARIDDGDGNPGNDIHQYLGPPGGGILGKYDGTNEPYIPRRVFHEGSCGYIVGEVKGPDVKVVWKRRVNTNVFEEVESWSYTVPIKTGSAK